MTFWNSDHAPDLSQPVPDNEPVDTSTSEDEFPDSDDVCPHGVDASDQCQDCDDDDEDEDDD